MASPMVDGRVEPHRKATYTLNVSDQIRNEEGSRNGFSGVKYNHKPTLAAGTRTTTLQPSPANAYELSLRDTSHNGDNDMFVFNGTRTAPTKSYVLVFDQTTQKATLERLDSTYTFNLATKNNLDVSSQQAKIYPKRQKDSVHDKDSGEEDLFGDERGEGADEGTEPDPSNPYDFRHFLNAVKTKKSDEPDKEYASSPDYRSNTGTGTANTPVPAARRAADPPKKRKAASVFAVTKPIPKKPGAKPSAKPSPNTPAIHLERRASDRPTPSTTSKKPAPTAAAPASTTSTKIKSAEFIHDSSSDNDIDFEFDDPSPSAASADSDTRSQTHLPINMHISNARSRALRSPSNGPISLASAATSVEGSPAPRRLDEEMEIDFGDLGGDEDGDGDAEGEEDEDVDIEMDGDMDAEGEEDGEGEGEREVVRKSGSSADANGNGNGIGMAAEVDEGEGEDEDDPLFQEMMEGLAGGDSSEESEEE